ncbi:hypothetical protein [Geomonas sp.]|uniref:hypothetical protein n=1 Tax=Geomonas sp. TaxID=2651584 RepID=UPI002B46AA78|nr:hypothetical protein [Geomonas sp.]HJV34342.1 hypothetical protein [Geomonas sp.]
MTILVVNEKVKQKAAISFGFDQQGPFAGPYLDTSNQQGPYAEDLLHLFVEGLNSGPDRLERLYRHYLTVREKVEGRPYGGPAFPKPGDLVYRATEPPDLASEIEQSLRNLSSGGWGAGGPSGKGGVSGISQQGGNLPPKSRPSATKVDGASLVERYVAAGNMGQVDLLIKLHDDLRQYLLKDSDSCDEIAALLPQLYQQSPQPDEQIQGGLHLLFDSLDILDQEIEVDTPDAQRRMEELQKAINQHVFVENEDPDLRAAVLNVLVQSRVEILPVLKGGTSHLLAGFGARTDLNDGQAEETLSGIARSFHSIGVTSPFEGAEELLQLLVVDDAPMQNALIGEMLQSDDSLLRDIAVLMLFHNEPEVRLGVSETIATVEGTAITSESLRRLIVSRNWFPEEIRKNVDRAITKARKARVECAALPKLPTFTVFASTIDGTGQQSFVVVAPDGDGFARCLVTLLQGEGIVNSYVAPLKTKYELEEFLKAVKKDPHYFESNAEHLDLRVCNGLADGGRAGTVPNAWLVRVAELLGRDRWRMIQFDAARELLLLHEELAEDSPQLLSDREYANAIEHSASLIADAPFLSSWYEDGEDIERVTEQARKNRESADSAVEQVLDSVLEAHRPIWLERLVVTALWLKSHRKPLIPWHKIYHLAQAVADETISLKEIPLMKAVAETSVRNYLASQTRKAPQHGGKQ